MTAILSGFLLPAHKLDLGNPCGKDETIEPVVFVDYF